jgi:hypothetical protein
MALLPAPLAASTARAVPPVPAIASGKHLQVAADALEMREHVRELLDNLPKCVECQRPATCAYELTQKRFCDDHAPDECPEYPRANAMRKIMKRLDE